MPYKYPNDIPERIKLQISFFRVEQLMVASLRVRLSKCMALKGVVRARLHLE